MTKGFSPGTIDLIDVRDERRCIACGGRGSERHHRRRRGVNHDGLAHLPANGGTFCGWGNHTGCHGKTHSNPEWAREMGYIVSSFSNPLDQRIWHYSRGWILLDNEGGWVTVEEAHHPSYE